MGKKQLVRLEKREKSFKKIKETEDNFITLLKM